MAIVRGLPQLPMRSNLRPPQWAGCGVGCATPCELHEPLEPQFYEILRAGFEALDLVNVGLLVTCSAGRMLLANHTAEQILRACDGLELTPLGVVRTSLKSTPTLNALIEAVAKPGPVRRESVLPLRRPSGKRPLTAVLRSVEASQRAQDPAGPATLLFLMDPEISAERVEAELRQLYGLTAMEASLANLLMEGKALDECCAILSIRRTTARTHLQHLFDKVGVQRQGELVSLLLRSVGLLGLGRNGAAVAGRHSAL
jgi:DNA-binding CsgD family transcriptional regulator